MYVVDTLKTSLIMTTVTNILHVYHWHFSQIALEDLAAGRPNEAIPLLEYVNCIHIVTFF